MSPAAGIGPERLMQLSQGPTPGPLPALTRPSQPQAPKRSKFNLTFEGQTCVADANIRLLPVLASPAALLPYPETKPPGQEFASQGPTARCKREVRDSNPDSEPRALSSAPDAAP